jgi:heme/copper-type cytochrome/quinol oxidase subunit 3
MASVTRKTIDVSGLPETTYDNSGVLWWGNCVMFLIEATTFVICWASYAYLRLREPDWPPGRDEMPRLLWATLGTVGILAAGAAVRGIDRIVERRDIVRLRLALVGLALFGFVLVALRAAEMKALAFRWDSHAYGSIVWVTLGLHLCHLVACSIETLVVGVVFYTGPVFDKHLADARVTGLYWYFLAAMWVPTYAILYLLPRYLRP